MTRFTQAFRPAALAVSAAVLLAVFPAQAAISYLSPVDIANAGMGTIEYIALSNDYGESWTQNMLWDDELPAGYYETMELDVSWDCMFDVFIAFDGGIEVVLQDVDMCSVVMIEAFEEGAVITDDWGDVYEVYDAGFDY